MSNSFDFKKSISLIFRYTSLASAVSASLAVILGCVVFWFLGPDVAGLISIYAGQTQPKPVAQVVPTGPIFCAVTAILCILLHKKHRVFPWLGLVFGLLGIGLLTNEMIQLIDSARFPRNFK